MSSPPEEMKRNKTAEDAVLPIGGVLPIGSDQVWKELTTAINSTISGPSIQGFNLFFPSDFLSYKFDAPTLMDVWNKYPDRQQDIANKLMQFKSGTPIASGSVGQYLIAALINARNVTLEMVQSVCGKMTCPEQQLADHQYTDPNRVDHGDLRPTPLSIACNSTTSPEIFEYLVNVCPQATKIAGGGKGLPLVELLKSSKRKTTTRDVNVLLETYADVMQDHSRAETCLVLALKKDFSFEVWRLLMQHFQKQGHAKLRLPALSPALLFSSLVSSRDPSTAKKAVFAMDQALAVVQLFPYLVDLEINTNHWDEGGLLVVIKALATNTSVTDLTVKMHRQLGKFEKQELLRAIQNNAAMKRITFSNACDINLLQLLKMLEMRTDLTAFKLIQDKFKYDVMCDEDMEQAKTSLSNFLSSSTTLTQLDMPLDELGQIMMDIVRYHIALNQNGRGRVRSDSCNRGILVEVLPSCRQDGYHRRSCVSKHAIQYGLLRESATLWSCCVREDAK